MMTPEELHQLCLALRVEQIPVTESHVYAIERDVNEYRAFMAQPRPQLPPEELAQRLPLMGWLMYEATLQLMRRIAPAFESLTDNRRSSSEVAYQFTERVADAARALPWPEFAPRALGAIRALAVCASKRDTEDGYDDAWILHEEAHKKHDDHLDSHAGKEPDDPNVIGLNEMFLQLALAETGTACRTAERVIGRWVDELDRDDPPWAECDEARWVQRMFRELTNGVAVGGLALRTAQAIKKHPGLVDEVDEHRMALRTALRQPGIMTARAILLILALCPEMERLGRAAPRGGSWAHTRDHLLAGFARAYRAIEEPDEDDKPLPLSPDHRRSVIQLRLNLALLVPGHDLPSRLTFDPCQQRNPLDDTAVEALSSWLAEQVDGRRRGDANVIGSATMPSFVRSVVACRTVTGSPEGYHQWRRRWVCLDRYAHEAGRERRVRAVLDQTQLDQPPHDG